MFTTIMDNNYVHVTYTCTYAFCSGCVYVCVCVCVRMYVHVVSHFGVQSSMELGPEDVSLLERCPHFRGCYVQSSMELGPVPIREVSSFQRVLCSVFNGVGT